MQKAIVTLGPLDYGMTGVVRNHKVVIDEPLENGGQDTGPAATEFLCLSLASCTVATLKMYANRKQWKIDSLSVEVEKDTTGGKNIFKRILHIKGELGEEQMTRLKQIADACPVHKILVHANTVETVFGN